MSWVWASVFEPVLNNLVMSPSPLRTGASLGLASPGPRDQNHKYPQCWQIPGWVSQTSKCAPPWMPHSCTSHACWDPLPSQPPAQLSPGHPPRQHAQNWNSLQPQLLVPSPSFVFDPPDRDAFKSCCLLSFYPSVSIVRPGWVPQSDTGDSHVWIKGCGPCCSVDPCHKKNGQNLNEQRNFRATCKSSLSGMFQTKKKKKRQLAA